MVRQDQVEAQRGLALVEDHGADGGSVHARKVPHPAQLALVKAAEGGRARQLALVERSHGTLRRLSKRNVARGPIMAQIAQE